MAGITVRPEMRTAGGEVSDIMLEGRYVGTLLLVYREQERISGSVQLEKESLSVKDKHAVDRFVEDYVQALIQAMKVKQCEVLVTYGSFDHVIATRGDTRLEDFDDLELLEEDDAEVIWVSDEDELGDGDSLERETFRMGYAGVYTGGRFDDDLASGNDFRNPIYYDLVLTKEQGSSVEYHVYDRDQEWVAEVFMRLVGNDLLGDVHWMFNPLDEEIETVTNLVVMDFNEELIDTFTVDHRYEGLIIDTIELTHKDLLEHAGAPDVHATADDLRDYTVVLVRDDGDMLTYEIYNQQEGGLPIGTATVDISRRQLSGFIDFRKTATDSGEREKIASLVMQELDKEKDYSKISFTMFEQNHPIGEVLFENVPVH